MPGLGNDLVVNLAGNNTKLKASIAESKGGLKGFASAAAGFLNPVTAGLTALAGGAIAAGVAIYGLQGNLATLDKVAKDAARTGVSGKFLQQLTFAADQSGVSIDQLTAGIKKLTIAVGKGDEKPFAKLGISLKELQGLAPEQQFLKVADAIGKLPTAADRAAASVAIFGKSGIEMTTLFSGGMDGIVKLMERAEELSIGVTAEGLAKVQAANDAIGQMKAAFGALIDQVTVGLAPAFTFVATTIADMIPPVTQLFAKFNELSDKAGFLSDLLDASMSVAFESIKANWDLMLGEMIVAAIDAGQKIASGIASPGAAIGGFIGGKVGKAVGGPDAVQGQTKLDTALATLAEVKSRLDAVKPFVPQGPKAPVKDDGSKLKGLFGQIAESAGPLVEGMKSKIGQEIGGAKLTGNWFAKTVENLIGDKIKDPKAMADDGKPETKMETQFVGAMQKGSAEAYSTIVAAMRGNKDPVVKATEKQTAILVKTLKENKPAKTNVIGAFA